MSNSIMKDGEESIPAKTAIARWADRAFKAEAEIDRLRHDIERMQAIDSEHLAEIERLRAENAELKGEIAFLSGREM